MGNNLIWIVRAWANILVHKLVRARSWAILFLYILCLSFILGHNISMTLVTAKICELAKSDMDVFKMVMPQLDQIYQNSQMLRISKSTKGRTAQAIVSQSKSNLPLMPTSMKLKSKDDINLANKRCVMKKK